MMVIHAMLFLSILPTVLSLDCNGPAEIAIAVPGSEAVPEAEFDFIEKFLTSIVSYLTISASNTRVGLILYGKDPVIIANLGDAPTRRSLNTRITVLFQRAVFARQISGGQNVPKAIEKVRDILDAGRTNVPKIGVILTFGRADLSSSDPVQVSTNIVNAAAAAQSKGIVLLALSAGGEVPGLRSVPNDKCGTFELGTYSSGLMVALRYFASAICYVLDPAVNPQPDQGICFPELLGQPQGMSAPPICTPGDILLADPDNCAYFYQCPLSPRPPVRHRCTPGTLFDLNIKTCNHMEAVTCYSGLTCPTPLGLFPHPTDRSKFLNCFLSIPRVQSCPSGQVFNSVKSYCDFP